MKGFDKKFKNFEDYILKITYEIWEMKKVGRLRKYYDDNIIVRSPDGIVVGCENVISATENTLAEFPDRQLLGEDVIWSGSPQKGMLSSHRIMSTATYKGNGSFGKTPKTKLKYRVIADCHAINNKINDEWLIRDFAAILKQLGKTPESFAKDLIKKEKNNGNIPFHPKIDVIGPYKGKGNDNKWGKKLSSILTNINKNKIDTIKKEYDRAVNLFYPSGVNDVGFEGAEKFWTGLISCFPNAKFQIHHRIGMDEKSMAPRAAVRWSINGKHSGKGMFGEPSQAEVYVMGITHAEFGKNGVKREFTLIDEVAVWKQIFYKKGEK